MKTFIHFSLRHKKGNPKVPFFVTDSVTQRRPKACSGLEGEGECGAGAAEHGGVASALGHFGANV